jgi:DUF971 family protein
MIAEAPPDEVIIRAGRSQLVLVFADCKLTISVSRLRAACRCADCRRERIDRDGDLENGDLETGRETIAEVRSVGDHALNIAFSDGHDRGIYPWSYLRELAREADAEAREAR